MLIIYNLSGLLLGLAGVTAGFLTALATGRISFGLVILAGVWLAFGWRKVDAATRQKRPFPSIFFIPLPFLAIPILLISLPIFFVERMAKTRPADPRAALLDLDEQMLRASRTSGDTALSEAIADGLKSMLINEAKAEEFRVFTRSKPRAILVLIEAPNLRQFKDEAREQLLAVVEGVLLAEDEESRDYYIGVKGRVAYGAVRVPPDRTETGAAVRESLLYSFYDDVATTRPAGVATTTTMLPATTSSPTGGLAPTP